MQDVDDVSSVNPSILGYMTKKPSKRPDSSRSQFQSITASDLGIKTNTEPTNPSKENRNKYNNKDSNRDIGAKNKRMGMSSADKYDKVLYYEKENKTLQLKSNLLEGEITKMNTKLRRIEGLMR